MTLTPIYSLTYLHWLPGVFYTILWIYYLYLSVEIVPTNTHCVKSVQIRSFFWTVFYCIWTRNSFVFGQFSYIELWTNCLQYWAESKEKSYVFSLKSFNQLWLIVSNALDRSLIIVPTNRERVSIFQSRLIRHFLCCDFCEILLTVVKT